MGDDVEERSVPESPAVVVNKGQFASVKKEILPLPDRFDWRRVPQRGDVSVAMLIDPPEAIAE